MTDQVTGFLSPWLRKKRLKITLPYIHGRILDYGCGVGALTQFCKPDAYLGVDIDEKSLEIARTTYPSFSFKQDVPMSEKFDTIICLAVIEHVPDPETLLGNFRMMLNLDGSIVLTTPHPSFEQVHTLGAKVGLFSNEASEDHEQLVCLTLMNKLANTVGLNVVTYRRFLFGANQLFVLKANE